MRTPGLHLLAAGSCLLATGCTLVPTDEFHYRESSEQVSRVDQHSSFPSVRRGHFEQMNLIELIDPRGEAATAYKKAWDEADRDPDNRKWGVKYDLVFAWFRESPASPETKRQHRDSVQDRILGVATSRCNVFKTYLRRQQTDWNFYLGSATTVAGVLGAVLPGVNSARNLAGTAGMLSGVQAEYNQQYYSNMAAHLLVQGVELHQKRLLARLVEDRKGVPVTEYSMEAAVKDALVYDGSCSTVTGLTEAADSIKEVTNPGLPRAFEIISGVRALREVAQADDFNALVESGKLQKLLKVATPSSSPLMVTAAKAAAPSTADRVVSAAQARTRIEKTRDLRAEDVGKAFTAAQARLPDASKNKDSAITAAAYTKRFKDQFATLATTDLPVPLCVAALDAPAKKLAEKQAIVPLRAEGSAERLVAAQDADLAKAEAALAAGRVELLIDAANQAIETTAGKWTPLVSANVPPKPDTLAAENPRGDLANLCK
jgi:hypothetical protein